VDDQRRRVAGGGVLVQPRQRLRRQGREGRERVHGRDVILFWRRTDVPGLERMVLTVSPDEVAAASTVICVEDGGFRLDHRWLLTPDWRARSLEVERWGVDGHRRLV